MFQWVFDSENNIKKQNTSVVEILEDFVNINYTSDDNTFEMVNVSLDDSWENPFNLEKSVIKIQSCFRKFKRLKEYNKIKKDIQIKLNYQKFQFKNHVKNKTYYYLSTNAYYN